MKRVKHHPNKFFKIRIIKQGKQIHYFFTCLKMIKNKRRSREKYVVTGCVRIEGI